MWFSGSGGVLHLESPGAASVPNLRPVQGRVRNVDGKPDAIVDEGAACRLSRRRCTQVTLTYERQRKRKEDL
jgi:hypothetical protein